MHTFFCSSPAGTSYSEAVDNLFKTLFPSDRSCLKLAEQKSAEFHNKDRDFQKAVQLVNIYSQSSCYAYIDNAGKKSKKSLFKTLNANLGSGQPKKHWKEMGALLSQGLALLGPKRFSDLYRGGYFRAVNIDTEWTADQFLSTSRDPIVALWYAPTKSFIHFKNVRGTDIHKYSQFPGEREILLAPGTNLTVVQLEIDIARIREEIKKISPTAVEPDDVKQYVVLDGSG